MVGRLGFIKRFQIVFVVLVQLLFVYTVLTQAAYVSITVTGQLVPTVIEPGESGNLVLTVANVGTEYARSVKLTVKPHSFITFGTSKYSLQTIAPSGSIQISVPITVSSLASEGSTSVFLSVEYNEGDSAGSVTTETSISLSITKRSLIEISNVTYDEDLIEQGDVVKMNIELKNVGNGNIKDIFVALKNRTQPFVSARGDMEVYLGNIQPGRTSMASFDIIINKDAETKAYSVPVTLTYYDETGTQHTEERYIGLKISGLPDFVVTLESQSNMYVGRTGELTISIANRGTATASFLLARFDGVYDITPEEYYIGDLEQDDYETITLDMSLVGVSVGKRALNIELAYKDPYNQETTTTETVDFTVHRAPPFSLSITHIVIIVAALVIIIWKRKFLIGLIRRK